MDLRLGLGVLGAVVVLAVAGSALLGPGRRGGRHSRRGQRQAPPVEEAITVPDSSSSRVMREDGIGGRIVYGRRWLEEHRVAADAGNPVLRQAPGRRAAQCVPDKTIDFIIRIPGHQPVARDLVLGIYRQEESLIDHKHHICALRYGTHISADLENEPAAGQYSDLVLSVQLADHHGPVSESELNRLSQIALKIADATKRTTQLSITFEEALSRAHDLDRFCSTFDVVASVNIVATHDKGFPGPAIRAAALAEGMRFGPRNIFHMPGGDPEERPVFRLASQYAPGEFDPTQWETYWTPGLTLFLDVPSVSQPNMVFEAMIRAAEGLAVRLKGQLLDQDRRTLSPEATARLYDKIGEIAEEMDRFSIPPGSARAVRLFSP